MLCSKMSFRQMQSSLAPNRNDIKPLLGTSKSNPKPPKALWESQVFLVSLHGFFFLWSKCSSILKSYKFPLNFQLSVPSFCSFHMGLHRNSLATALTLKQYIQTFCPSATFLNKRATQNPQVPQWKHVRLVLLFVLFFFPAHIQM